MRLTTFTDYSLRLLMYLAAAPERRATIAEVARAYGISEHHMVKVVHVLERKATGRTPAAEGAALQTCLPGA